MSRRYAPTVTPEELANLAHLRRARDLMDREYARPLDVAALARAALMSTAHFSRQFRATYGETPYAYLMTRRIERAKALLRRGDLSVTEVCLEVGCTSLGSFSARFTELVGETPTAYRVAGPRRTGERAGLRGQEPHPAEPPAEQSWRSGRGAGPLALAAWSSLFPAASSRSTTPTSPSPSTATRSASRSATTSPMKASAGSPSAAASQPEIAIVLSDYVNGGPADRDAVAALLAKGALNGVHFRTDDIDAAFERVRAAGAEIVQEPTDQFWGVRDFAVRDPSGNLVRVDQAPAG